MNTLRHRALLILLTLCLGTHAAWSSQDSPAASATGSHAKVPESATAKSGKNAGAANEGLPSIIDEEDIPAYLRGDPCDTGNS
jgi:hypothetical protein